MNYWLSVDTDDICHLPSNRGHPTRSSNPMEFWKTDGYQASKQLLKCTDSFMNWASNGPDVTIFLIAEQLDCPAFYSKMKSLLDFPNITIACHGWGHRCWSAWPKEISDFSDMLIAAKNRLSKFAGPSWRPWFRAPGGYVSQWMAAPLAAAGFSIDSSVNPSKWVARKMNGNWKKVITSMNNSGLKERPWLVSKIGPACGPALSLFPFSLFAKRAWSNASKGNTVNPENEEVNTLYWHILDHGRKAGKWEPPLSKEK
ncbi:MAG: polysaccharide deacetylase family protein [Candidatus Thalassarchaeaceae archaeon]|nr:polysaccharide deacetylase family protein [Candidatus Thalassarchaeaceae archaeon]